MTEEFKQKLEKLRKDSEPSIKCTNNRNCTNCTRMKLCSIIACRIIFVVYSPKPSSQGIIKLLYKNLEEYLDLIKDLVS